MNESDKILALVRLPEYAKNFDEFQKADRKLYEENKRKICKRWGLDVKAPLPQPLITNDVDEALLQSYLIKDRYQSVDKGVEVISHPEIVLPLSLDESEIESEFENIKDVNQSLGTQYLDLRIDLTATVEDIEKEVHEQIMLYRQFIRLKEERKREYTFDPWYVYDLKNIKKLTLWQMAANHYNTKGYPKGKTLQRDNPVFDSIYKKIQRAYKQAEEYVKRVGDYGRRDIM